MFLCDHQCKYELNSSTLEGKQCWEGDQRNTMFCPTFFAARNHTTWRRRHAGISVCVRRHNGADLVFVLCFNFLRDCCCLWSCCCRLPLAESVQAGQDLGVAVVIQTDAADQELLVYLTHHWAGAPSLVLRHGRGHLNPRAAANL